MVYITFLQTGPGVDISSIDLSAYIPKPMTGGEPIINFYTGTCYGTVEWKAGITAMTTGFFKMTTVYTAEVTLTPAPGYIFPGGLTVTHVEDAVTPVTVITPFQAEVSITFPITGNILPLAFGGAGKPWVTAGGAVWVTAVTAVSGFSRGGGGSSSPADAVNCGGRGPGTTAYAAGKAGHSARIIRFLHPGSAA